jgi:hypothetical protein
LNRFVFWTLTKIKKKPVLMLWIAYKTIFLKILFSLQKVSRVITLNPLTVLDEKQGEFALHDAGE